MDRYGPSQKSTLVKTALKLLLYAVSSAFTLPSNDEVVFTTMSSASVCKIANLHSA